MSAPTTSSADRLVRAERIRVGAIMPTAVVVAVLAGLLVAKLADKSHPVQALLLPLLAVPFILWRWPRFGIYVVMVGAVTVEQFAYTIGTNKKGAITDNIPFFHSIQSGSGVTPAEIFLFLAVLLWVLRTVRDGARLLPRSPVSAIYGVYLGLVVVYLLYGLSHGGHYKIAIWEIRPWFYLGIVYVLAAQLLTTRASIRIILWIMVLGSPVKAFYGIILWLQTRNLRPRPEAVLAHEESFFFGIYIFLAIALWIFQIRGRLRVVATALLPIVILGDMMNSRRTAWAILGVGGAALLIVAYARLPERRRLLSRIVLVLVVIAPVYLPLYWNKDGTLAQPARAVRSAVHPDARDKASDLYRTVENADLIFNVRATHDTGNGFGVPIDYVYPLINLAPIDSAIAFIPHDGVYYIWMRMGILGEIVFWLFISAALIRCCRLAQTADRELAMFGAFVASAIVGYVVMGYEDMGFFWFRLAFAIGIFLGIVEAQLRIIGSQPSGTTEVPDRRDADSLVPLAAVGTTRESGATS